MPTDTRFCYGASCTWYGPITEVSDTSRHPAHTYGRSPVALPPNENAANATLADGLPCCPICGGMLYEFESPAPWWDGVDKFERGDYPYPAYLAAKGPQPADWKPRPHPGYRKMCEWQKAQNRCFRHVAHLKNSYKKHAGIEVDLTP